MLLCVDIGNTYSKFAIFQEHGMIFNSARDIPSYDGNVLNCIGSTLSKYKDVEACVICSVASKETTLYIVEKITYYCQAVQSNCKIYQITCDTPLPFNNKYQSKTLGADRIVCVAGAQALYGNNVLIIDAGTCITVDYLDKENNYQGGSISLGFMSKYKALNTFTANLPLVSILEDVSVCAKTTEKAIASGVVNGTLFEIEQTISHYKAENGDMNVVLCGGDAEFIAKRISHKTIVNKDIAFWGLKNIYEYNYANNDKQI